MMKLIQNEFIFRKKTIIKQGANPMTILTPVFGQKQKLFSLFLSHSLSLCTVLLKEMSKKAQL